MCEIRQRGSRGVEGAKVDTDGCDWVLLRSPLPIPYRPIYKVILDERKTFVAERFFGNRDQAHLLIHPLKTSIRPIRTNGRHKYLYNMYRAAVCCRRLIYMELTQKIAL
jgi:hypothetical protein